MTFAYKRAILAFTLAAILAIPTLFEQTWKSGAFTAITLTILNVPGILVAVMGRFFPPEGFPGQSPLRSILMILVQSVCWYAVFSLLSSAARRRDSKTRS